jgi:type II secretory ATPase GspE/PulE/Tfp pilus assembly ATPase PilB-like protein
VLAALKTVVQRPYGILLVCGPTGSGKTTTLHSLLSFINTADLKIWTAEDRSRSCSRACARCRCMPKIGWTFAAAMRSFLRADPDVIMVGEMRDEETARIGIEASLTGHLVLSTLHTNSAPESVVRLLDMGMQPFNFADSMLGILAQRLVRRLCVKCKVVEPVDAQTLKDLATSTASRPSSRRTRSCRNGKNATATHRSLLGRRAATSAARAVTPDASGFTSCSSTRRWCGR